MFVEFKISFEFINDEMAMVTMLSRAIIAMIVVPELHRKTKTNFIEELQQAVLSLNLTSNWESRYLSSF